MRIGEERASISPTQVAGMKLLCNIGRRKFDDDPFRSRGRIARISQPSSRVRAITVFKLENGGKYKGGQRSGRNVNDKYTPLATGG
jgi:hypothetical protein